DLRLRPVVDATGTATAPPTVNAVRLQVLYDDDAVAVRVTWHDPTEDRLPAAPDAAQAGANTPDALAMVLRPSSVPGDVVTLQAWPLRHHLPLDLCVWSAQREQAREAVAKDYDPLLGEAPAGLPMASRATYADGQWSLVLTRFREPADIAGAAQLTPGTFHPVAFVVWDGGNPGQRAISPWIDLMFPSSE
ncbi:MAG: hypothetical protein HYY91_00320, partial [Candidatus Omnitrophica bacterium]|nr:hypothetical protein [Candidatus Omnitrophota bacterium]